MTLEQARLVLLIEVIGKGKIHQRSKCNVYAIFRQTQLGTRWYANLLNVNLSYMFRPQSLAIIRLYKIKLIS